MTEKQAKRHLDREIDKKHRPSGPGPFCDKCGHAVTSREGVTPPTTRIHCEAGTRHTRLSPSGFGFERIPCSQSVGLSSWQDRAGTVRYACSQEGHRYQVERLFGVEDPPEPEWDLDALDAYKSFRDFTESEARLAMGDR